MRPDPSVLFEQVRAGLISVDALIWLQEGFAAFGRAGDTLTLERCLHLPTIAQRRRRRRDHWICRASSVIGGDSIANKAERLGRELDAFLRGTWREWQHLENPPSYATPQREALFYLAKSIGRNVRPCDMRLAQVIRKESAG